MTTIRIQSFIPITKGKRKSQLTNGDSLGEAEGLDPDVLGDFSM